MTFLNFSHVRISEEFLAHVLTGEEGNAEKGGHLSGLRRENKTEFPPEWDEEHIRQALESVLASPQYVEIVGFKVVLRRIVAGVNIQVVLISRQSALMPFAAYPTGGPGVIQNIMGVQHPLPLHNPRNGR
jgi:hypothetical protein